MITEDVYQYKISVTKGTLRKVFHSETHTIVYKNSQIRIKGVF